MLETKHSSVAVSLWSHWWGVEGADGIWEVGLQGVRVTIQPKLFSGNREDGKGGLFRVTMSGSFWEWVDPFSGHSKAKDLALERLVDEKNGRNGMRSSSYADFSALNRKGLIV